ncbi:MAG: UMP kinase [Verrucomicrobiales bacterium]|nr:UMP kinase [Verrucomicrobiales bacterium]
MARDFKRVILKLSGEALREPGSQDNISPEIVEGIANQIKAAHQTGLEIAIVVGGGNFWRGAAAAGRGMERATADYVGMLATVMNALAVQSMLEAVGVPSRVQTAIEMKNVAETFIRRLAIRHLEKGRVVIFGAGTGNPFFTTDTTAALRASEIGADIIFKATNVDGVYDKDPNAHDSAKRYENVSYNEALSKNLKVMDGTAFTLCQDNSIPIVVFNMNEGDNIRRALMGEEIGTIVSSDD